MYPAVYDKLITKEKIIYIFVIRGSSDIIFKKVQIQPDAMQHICCAIYTAASATTIALGSNPYEEKYFKNVKSKKKHFWNLIVNN